MKVQVAIILTLQEDKYKEFFKKIQDMIESADSFSVKMEPVPSPVDAIKARTQALKERFQEDKK